MKRVPLARGTKPLVRTPFAKRGRMRRVSRKMVLRIAAESPVRKAYKAAHPECEMAGLVPARPFPNDCRMDASDLHEPWPRSAGGPTDDPSNFVHLCRPCHHWITFTAEGAEWAFGFGFRIHSYAGAAWLAAGGRAA